MEVTPGIGTVRHETPWRGELASVQLLRGRNSQAVQQGAARRLSSRSAGHGNTPCSWTLRWVARATRPGGNARRALRIPDFRKRSHAARGHDCMCCWLPSPSTYSKEVAANWTADACSGCPGSCYRCNLRAQDPPGRFSWWLGAALRANSAQACASCLARACVRACAGRPGGALPWRRLG